MAVKNAVFAGSSPVFYLIFKPVDRQESSSKRTEHGTRLLRRTQSLGPSVVSPRSVQAPGCKLMTFSADGALFAYCDSSRYCACHGLVTCQYKNCPHCRPVLGFCDSSLANIRGDFFTKGHLLGNMGGVCRCVCGVCPELQ